MTISERIEAAFRLGDEDLEIYMAKHEVTREEAQRQMRNARQAERPRPSRCKGGD